jgi:hypothetical protein
MVITLLCNAQGCPVGVEVFAGNTQDASTGPEKIAQSNTARSVIRAELFDENQIVEVFDPEGPKRRYRGVATPRDCRLEVYA